MVSFVIRTKNEEARLEQVLDSIENQNIQQKSEVIIVDSGSTDRTLQIAEKYNCKIVQIKQEDFSWGYALNIGIAMAQGEYIGIISGHCILMHRNCIAFLMDAFKKNPDIQVIYGRQCGDSKDDPFEMIDYIKTYPSIKGLHRLSEEPQYRTTISNACSFIRKSCWKKFKFDECVQSCEDAKWAKELIEAHKEIAYYGEIGVYHSHPLNVNYLYCKCYAREYEMEKIRSNPKSKVYYLLKFLVKHTINQTLQLKKDFYTNRCKMQMRKIIKYSLVCNIANYNACIDFLSGKSFNYFRINIPNYLKDVI